MRYLVSILATLLCTFTVMAQSENSAVQTSEVEAVAVVDNNALWERGNQAYIEGDFQSAISSYSAI